MKIKYIIGITITAALLSTACSSDSGEEPSPAVELSVVRFGVSRVQTRADGSFVDGSTVKTIPVNGRVGIFGYYNEDAPKTDWTAGLKANFFYNFPMVGKSLTNENTSTELDYENKADTHYWPNTPGEKLSFYAYYPYNGNGITIDQDGFNNGGLGKINYEIASNATQQIDLMVSDVIVNRTRPEKIDARESFEFHHALAQVIINVNQSTLTAKGWESVDKLVVKGLKQKGTLTPAVNESTGVIDLSNAWTTEGSTDVTIDNFNGNNPILLAIPTDDVTSTVSVDIHKRKGSSTESETINLTGINAWKPGQKYTYNLAVQTAYSGGGEEDDKNSVVVYSPDTAPSLNSGQVSIITSKSEAETVFAKIDETNSSLVFTFKVEKEDWAYINIYTGMWGVVLKNIQQNDIENSNKRAVGATFDVVIKANDDVTYNETTKTAYKWIQEKVSGVNESNPLFYIQGDGLAVVGLKIRNPTE